MVPKIVHHCSDTLAWEERRIIARTKAILNDYKFYIWSQPDHLAMVEKYFPEKRDIFLGFKQPVVRVDIGRCLYLYEYGGIYVDTDYKFFRRPSGEFMNSSIVLGVEDPACKSLGGIPKYGNALMASAPGLDFWLDFVEDIFSRSHVAAKSAEYLSGPHAITDFIRKSPKYHDLVRRLPQQESYPDFRLRKLTGVRNENTLGVHLCWGSWRNKSFAKSVANRARRIMSATI